MLTKPGLYVHLPWCVKKCPYCDFNSHPLKTDADFAGYTHALIEDFASQQRRWSLNEPFASVFFGGGTPSLFAAEYFALLLKQLPLIDRAPEITMEANPGTTEHADFSDYLEGGINRLSIGAQSFNDAALQSLGRIHGAKDTAIAYEQARQGGFSNINIDLMWGLPNQSVAQCLADLDAAIALQPEHISWYQLTLEPKTEFARRPPMLPVENELHRMEQMGIERLAKHGYQRYEVSAFSQPGYQCRHNRNYWQFGDYLGLGAGAHGKLSANGTVLRTNKPHQPRLYLADPLVTVEHEVDAANLAFEFMLNTLRLVDGVSFETFPQQTGLPVDFLEPSWATLVAQNLVREDRLATTALGFRYLDSVVAAFLPQA